MQFRFEGYELDTDAYELRCAGEPVPVEPQVFEVLAHLVTHRDRLVTKEELLDRVWGDRFVSESALTSRLKSARQAVGDDGTAQRVIRTIHGRGYRFIAPVDVHDGTLVAAAAPAPVPTPTDHGPALGRAPVAVLERPSPDVRPAARTGDWPLLGRAVELSLLADCFHGGLASGVLLTGHAGAGKSRLAAESMRMAEAAGTPTARAVGHPEARTLPLAALTHLLPADVAEAGADGELDVAAVFHRARVSLRERAGDGRLLLWVDDVDQLDQLSIAVLASLLVSGDVFGVLTMRTPGEIPAALRSLVKEGHLEQIDLPPLGDLILESLLHVGLGGPVESGTARLFVETADGNAAVLRQLVASCLDAGSLVNDDGVWTLRGPLVTTSDLRQLVADRIAGLDDAARRALEILAVATECGLEVLTALTGDDALEDLDDRGLLEVRTSKRRTDVALAHPLFGEILRAELPALRARRLRHGLADAIEQRGARRREDLVRIAAWRLGAGGSVDTDTLVDAARLALADGDLRVAGPLIDRIESSADRATAAQLRAEWFFRRGESHRVEEVLAGLERDDIPDRQWAQLVRRRATNRFYALGDYDGSLEVIEASLTEVAGESRSALEALHCTLLALVGHIETAVVRSEQILAAATGSSRFEVLRARALALAIHGSGRLALDVVDEGLRLRASLTPGLHVPGVMFLRFAGTTALTERGAFEEAERSAAEARNQTVSGDGGWTSISEARLALAVGDTEAALAALERPLRTVRAMRHLATERWLLALHAHALLLRGDVAGARQELRRVTELEDGRRSLFHNDIDRAKAWLRAHDGDTASAVDDLFVSADEAAAHGKRTFEMTLVHDVVRLGAPELVVDRLRRLAATIDGPLVGHCAAHAEALAAGDVAGLLAVCDEFDQVGATVFAAEAAAQAAAAAGARGDARSAEAATDRAAALARRRPAVLRTPALVPVVGAG